MDSLDKRERYARAMTVERDAWNEVKHTLPGSPHFDEGKWRRWQAALHAVGSALDATRYVKPKFQAVHDKPGRDR